MIRDMEHHHGAASGILVLRAAWSSDPRIPQDPEPGSPRSTVDLMEGGGGIVPGISGVGGRSVVSAMRI